MWILCRAVRGGGPKKRDGHRKIVFRSGLTLRYTRKGSPQASAVYHETGTLFRHAPSSRPCAIPSDYDVLFESARMIHAGPAFPLCQ